MTYRPAVVPTGTYRLQIQPAFTFDDAAEQAEHLAALGVSHAYLSPVLAPATGSTHGYDVVDHSHLNPEAGGRPAFDRLTQALRAAGLGAVADVVPNHVAVPTPASDNAQLWSVLREGPGSPFASWFDVDWSVPDRAILMAVLGQRIGQVLAAGSCPWTAPVTSPSCATTTTSSRSGRARRTCPWRSWSTASGTGWRTGGSPTRS